MQPDFVIHQTRERFPLLAGETFTVIPLEKGGSGRKYYRVSTGEASSMIVVKYSPERTENLRFVDLDTFLDESGVRVPRIYLHDADAGLIWMQDLGGTDLWSLRDDDWATRGPAYRSAIEAVFALHTSATQRFEESPVSVELEFDQQLYLWEQGYFIEHCLVGVFKVSAEEASRYAELPALRRMADELAAQDRVLVHRDFQSQNVLVSGGQSWLIDFQGLRPGLAQYDLASLLYDPYVSLTDGQRTELLLYYRNLAADQGEDVGENFEKIFWMCAAQRLMQALGAYGFLGNKGDRPDFLDHIPAARRSLTEVVGRIDGMDEFTQLLEALS
ncbi:MAG: phosphotransferase [Chthoniobacterales bacterium]